MLESEDGVSPAWPIDYDELEPYYAEAERLFRVHGDRRRGPHRGARSTPFPYPAVPHEPVIADVADSFERQGLRPFPLPLGIDLREGGTCIRCKTCDGVPMPGPRQERCRGLRHDARPRVAERVDDHRSARRSPFGPTRPDGVSPGSTIDLDGARRTVIASTYVRRRRRDQLRRAAAPLRLGPAPERPGQLDRVWSGRNYMAHINSALMAIRPKVNGTVFQKTLALNDWYFGESNSRVGMGHAQLLGKLQAEMLEAAVPWVPNRVLAELADRSVDWYLMTEDLPDPENRVSLDCVRSRHRELPGEQRPVAQAPRSLHGDGDAAGRLPDDPDPSLRPGRNGSPMRDGAVRRRSRRRPSSTRCAEAMTSRISSSWTRRSCPSSSAQNPALTVAAQALRVGEKAAFN